MMYDALMSLRLTHEYYAGPPPVRADLREAALLAREGVLAKAGPAALTLWQETGETRPDTLSFDIWSTDPALLHVSPALSAEAVTEVAIDAPSGSSEHRIVPATPSAAPAPLEGRRPLARLTVTLPPEGVPALQVILPAAEAIWAYHVLGRADDSLSVVDTAGEVTFEAVAPTTLPDGRRARCYRSDRPLALRARTAARFSLMQDGPFGPQTLIEALPAAGAVTSYADGSGPDAKMQSDIYVTL